jgi:chemotaxis response regulator CheB
MPIRVLLADDSDSLRGVIERHLKFEPKIELVGQAFDERNDGWTKVVLKPSAQPQLKKRSASAR